MLTFRNHSDKLIVVLHEIYGINEHIKRICQNFCNQGYDVICPDLLWGENPFSYDQEEEAYLYFTKNIGFQSASEQVKQLLAEEQKNYNKIFLMGYSIGATIAWLCSESIFKIDGMIGFYGSRIRDYMILEPKYPTLLIYPEEERSFDPRAIQQELMSKEMVKVYIMEGKHGFADPFSMNYKEKSAREADRIVTVFLTED